MKAEAVSETKRRYGLPDTVRGILVLGMIAYHTLFDIAAVYGWGMDTPLMRGVNVIRDLGAACFVFLSGFCFHLGRRNLRKGLLLSAAGAGVTAVTFLFDRESFVLFGVLTFLGAAKLLLWALERPLRYVPSAAGCAVSLAGFLLFFRCNFGYAGYYGAVWFRWPAALYRNYITAFFGFPFNGFSSADYFSLLPWFFLSCGGWFFWRAMQGREAFPRLLRKRVSFLAWVGQYSLWIYLIHQPVIYFAVSATKNLFL